MHFYNHITEKVEYTFKLGATVEPTASIGRGGAGAYFYEKGRLLVACGGGGASGWYGGSGGDGGGAGVAGHLDQVKIVGQVAQNIMMVIFQQLESCHLERLVVK